MPTSTWIDSPYADYRPPVPAPAPSAPSVGSRRPVAFTTDYGAADYEADERPLPQAVTTTPGLFGDGSDSPLEHFVDGKTLAASSGLTTFFAGWLPCDCTISNALWWPDQTLALTAGQSIVLTVIDPATATSLAAVQLDSTNTPLSGSAVFALGSPTLLGRLQGDALALQANAVGVSLPSGAIQVFYVPRYA